LFTLFLSLLSVGLSSTCTNVTVCSCSNLPYPFNGQSDQVCPNLCDDTTRCSDVGCSVGIIPNGAISGSCNPAKGTQTVCALPNDTATWGNIGIQIQVCSNQTNVSNNNTTLAPTPIIPAAHHSNNASNKYISFVILILMIFLTIKV